MPKRSGRPAAGAEGLEQRDGVGVARRARLDQGDAGLVVGLRGVQHRDGADFAQLHLRPGDLQAPRGGAFGQDGAALLGGFTVLTIPIAHDFWNMKDPQAHTEFYTVLEHIAIVGGLMVMAIWAGNRAKAVA